MNVNVSLGFLPALGMQKPTLTQGPPRKQASIGRDLRRDLDLPSAVPS